MNIQHFLIDFDETLATSTITWGLEYSVPKLIKKHGLLLDELKFSKLVIDAIKRISAGDEVRVVAKDVFVQLDWPSTLHNELLHDVMSNYQPAVFDDVLPFLTKLKQKQKTLVVISNNPHTSGAILDLELSHFFDAIVTPLDCEHEARKPDILMWDCVRSIAEIDNMSECMMIGDDPWSDAEFATRVGIDCILVDRNRRFISMENYEQYRWVASLNEILVE